MRLPKTAAPFSAFSIKTNETDSLKKFPKGILFAFSGVFFLLTLLVLFQSKEPFGIAAVVAYIACLTLTILLFSAPYFASYYINYYKKLHQIEEAILLLSDQGKSRTRVQSVDELTALPPYSAVSALTDEEQSEYSQLAEESLEQNVKETVVDGSQKSAEIETLSSDIIDETSVLVGADAQEETVSEVTKRKAAVKKKAKSALTSEDEFQLSLFDSHPTEVDSDAPGETVPSAMSPIDSDTIKESEIHVYLLLDASAKLFIRGDAPFSWDKGVEMKALDVGKFTTEGFEIDTPIKVQFLINDNKKKKSEEFVIEPGNLNECYPEI